MNKLLKSNDSLTQAAALIGLSCIPFYTLGQLCVEIPMWISYIVGGGALLFFVIRIVGIIIGKIKPQINPRVDSGLKNIIGFSFPLAVAEGIVEYVTGNSDWLSYLFPGLLFLCGIIIMFAPARSKNQ